MRLSAGDYDEISPQSSDGNTRQGMIDSGKGKGVFDMHVMSKHNLVELIFISNSG